MKTFIVAAALAVVLGVTSPASAQYVVGSYGAPAPQVWVLSPALKGASDIVTGTLNATGGIVGDVLQVPFGLISSVTAPTPQALPQYPFRQYRH
jgi:hypothetical protein